MAVHDPDVWQLASMLIERFGEEASAHAAAKAKEALADGDRDDAAVWSRIYAAVAELLRDELEPGERRH